MKQLNLNESSPRGIPLVLCALSLIVVVSSCATTPSRRRNTSTPAEPNSRSELVFINMEEASGWVAYECDSEGDGGETENYRVVVIRQKSGEIIYDSQIPLASNLCTHGFEMAPEDPRLKRLGQNVDREIIEPLEAYQKSLENETSAETTAVQPEATSTPAPPKKEKVKKETVEAEPTVPVEAVAAVTITGMDGDFILLDFSQTDLPVAGDRFFLRSTPEVIEIPGTDETVLASEGEVTGLVEIVSVEGTSAQSQLLSGDIPKAGTAEKVGTP